MQFNPNKEERQQQVPFFQDTRGRSDEGWQGQGSKKSIEKLQEEIRMAMQRLGGYVVGFEEGTYSDEHNPDQKRDGLRIHYVIKSRKGEPAEGVIDIAALPVRWGTGYSKKVHDNQRKQAMRAALYMTHTWLQGVWNMQQLSPGFAALMPFLRDPESGKTITQLWSESGRLLLPESSATFEGQQPWYEVLGLETGPLATYEEAEQAYRQLVKQVHPDTGGDQEEFLKVQSAWAAAKAELS